MDAQSGTEVRRLHIVYFLSRKGSIEHPHLIRVHHLSRNGVRLRDVKRWLGELRGKEIPESFSWSYKRKYKTGYVWQDLLDDDLINPISDNEYVLKGSEISSSTIKVGKQKNQEDEKTACKEENQAPQSTDPYISTKSSSEIEEESPTFSSETSTLTDDSARIDTGDKLSGITKHEIKPICQEKIRHSTFYSAFMGKKSYKRVKNEEHKIGKLEAAAAAALDSSKVSSSEPPQSTKTKNHSMLRNLITCGDVGTNDSVKAINKQHQNKPFLNMCSSDVGSFHSASICRKEVFGGSQSQRIFGNPNWTQPQWSNRKSFDGVKDSSKSEAREQRAAYKPIYGPNCSQCGKPFKPEKLHGHMKSCKGMKAMSKCGVANAAAAAAESASSKGSMDFHSVSGHLLTH